MPTPQRLPIVNSDDGVWGDILRQYLLKEHYDDGTDNAANGGHKTITIQPGTASAGTAPLKFTSGTLLSTPEAGAVEFNTDKLYFTKTTGTTRQTIASYDTTGATGDIYYRDSSSNFVKLGIGSDNDVLKVSGGLPSWSSTTTGQTIDLANNTLTGTTAQFNTALSDNDFATLAGTETLTNKTLTSPTITNPIVNQIMDTTNNGTVLVFTGYASPSAHWRFYNGTGATSSTVLLTVEGTATNINARFYTKGSGVFQHYVTTGQTTATISGIGADGNTHLDLTSQGTGVVKANGVEVVTISGTQTLTNKTLTSPKVNGLLDTSGGTTLVIPAVASAANYFQMYSAPSAALPPALQVAGPDTDIGIRLIPKGAGVVQIYEGAAQTSATILASGTASNVDLNLSTKGSGVVQANGVPVATTADTQTLTNKTLTSPAIGGTTKIAQSGVVELYNTADQVINYEKLRLDYDTNVAQLTTFYGGTGGTRSLRLGIGTAAGTSYVGRYLQLNYSAPFYQFLTNTSSTGSVVQISNIAGAYFNASSGNQTFLAIDPELNQSGTAGYTGLLINPTETATGSGTKLLIDAQVGGVSKFTVDNTGVVTMAAVGTGAGSVVTTDGTQTLTNKTLTSPKLSEILDTNGATSIAITATASAVNYFSVINRAAAVGGVSATPTFSVNGPDTNINLGLFAKGDGIVYISPVGRPALEVNAESSSQSWVRISGRNSTASTISVVSYAADASLNLVPRGTGVVQANGVEVATISGTQTLTSKTISGASNTLSNIPQSAITNLDMHLSSLRTGANLVTNPGFELDLYLGAYGAYDSSVKRNGTRSVRIDSDGSAPNIYHVTDATYSLTYPCQDGETFYFEEWVYGDAGNTQTTGWIELCVVTRNSANVQQWRNQQFAASTSYNGTWTKLSATLQISQADVQWVTFLTRLNGIPTGDKYYFDDPIVYRVGVPGTNTSPALLAAGGSDTNIDLNLTSKGTGAVTLKSNTNGVVLYATPAASGVNYFQMISGATGTGVQLYAIGSDTNISNNIYSKGTGAVNLRSNTNGVALSAQPVASGVNYLSVYGAATGSAPYLLASGTDTNINLNLVPKGTGVVQAGGVEVATLSDTQTLTNKTISGASNTITNLPASATPDVARKVWTSLSTVSGQWTKVLTYTPGNTTLDRISLCLSFVSFAHNTSAIVALEAGITSSTSSASIELLSKAAGTALGADSFKIISDGSGADFELWIKTYNNGSSIVVSELSRYTHVGTLAYTPGVAFQGAVPTGSDVNAQTSSVTTGGVPVATTTGTQTLTNKTIDGASNTITNLPASSFPDGARLVGTTASGGAGGEWSKIATFSTASYSGGSATLLIQASNGSIGETAIITAAAYSPTTGQDCQVSVEMIAKSKTTSYIATNAFKMVTGTYGTAMELWFKKNASGSVFAIYELSRSMFGSGAITYYTDSAWQAGTPSGTVEATTAGVTAFGLPVATTTGTETLTNKTINTATINSATLVTPVFSGAASGNLTMGAYGTNAHYYLASNTGLPTLLAYAATAGSYSYLSTNNSGVVTSLSGDLIISSRKAGSSIIFGTTSSGNTDVERMKIDSTGAVTIGGAAAVTTTGTQTLTNKTLTSPMINQISDTNGNASLSLTATASAVNYIDITNAATSGGVYLQSKGTDTDVSLNFKSKGSNSFIHLRNDSGMIASFGAVSSAVNYLFINSNSTGGPPVISATGTDTNIGITLNPKGTGSVMVSGVPVVTTSGTQTLTNKTLTNPTIDSIYSSSGGRGLLVAAPSGSVNYIGVYGNPTGSPVYVAAKGTDANIHLYVSAQGTGSVNIGNSGGQGLQVFGATSTANNFQLFASNAGGSPSIHAVGTDTNISFDIVTKGTGTLRVNSVDVATVSGTQTLTNKTLTSPTLNSPKIAAINDAGNNPAWAFTTTASAVNYITSAGGATGIATSLSATGTDTNIGINVFTKGTGVINLRSVTNGVSLGLDHVASSVNYLRLTNAATGNAPTFTATGTDTNISVNIAPKGTGVVQANGNPIISSVTGIPAVTGTPSSSTYLRGDGTWSTPSGGGDMVAATYDPATISEQVVGLTATQTLTNKTLTAPKFANGGYIADANGNNMLAFYTSASAVNYFYFSNSATGNYPSLGVGGSDTNIGYSFAPKGTGTIQIYENAGQTVATIAGQGSATNVDLNLTSQGTGVVKANGTPVVTSQNVFPMYMDPGRFEPFPQIMCHNNWPLTAGDMPMTLFTPSVDMTVSNIITMTSGTSTQTSATACKVAIFRVDDLTSWPADMTCIARSADKSDRWNGALVDTAPIVDDGAASPGSISSVNLTAGQQYAVGFMSVGHTGSIQLAALGTYRTNTLEPHLGYFGDSGYSDIPVNLTGGWIEEWTYVWFGLT